MPLPRETFDYIDEIVKSASLSSLSPYDRVDWIYNYLRRFDYGIDEAVLSGTRFRYPHQIKNQFTCGECGVYTYALAKLAGLNPRVFRLTNFNDMPSDHLIVDAEIDGRREAIDALWSLRNPIKYRLGRLIFERRHPIKFCGIETMDEDDINGFINYINSREGILNYLAVKQKCRGYKGTFGVMEQFISFSPELRNLVVSHVLLGLPPWEIAWEFLATVTSSPSVKMKFGRKSFWGEIKNPFFETEVNIVTGDRKSSFYPENAYRDLKRDAFKILMYYQAVIGSQVFKNGDGIFVRSHEENERFIDYLKKDVGKDETLKDLRELERDNPSYYRRYLDYFGFVFFDYSQESKRRGARKLLQEEGITTLERMLDVYVFLLHGETEYHWISYIYRDNIVSILSSWVKEVLE